MSEPKKREQEAAAENAIRPLSDAEVAKIVGGTGTTGNPDIDAMIQEYFESQQDKTSNSPPPGGTPISNAPGSNGNFLFPPQ